MSSEQLIHLSLAWLQLNVVPVLAAAAVLVLGWLLSRFSYRTIRRLLPRAYGVDKNFAPLLAQAARYGIVIFALITALSFLGVSSASIYAVLGAAGLAVALALQGTLSNIAAGIMLIWLRPISIGEYITGDGVAGVVVEIGLFGTRLRSTSGLYIFTPNQKLWSSAITNHSREPKRRIDVDLSVPDRIDIAAARRTLLDILRQDSGVLADPAASVHVDSFTEDKIVLQIRAWVATPHYLEALRAITEEAKLALNEVLASLHAGRTEASVAADPHATSGGNTAASGSHDA